MLQDPELPGARLRRPMRRRIHDRVLFGEKSLQISVGAGEAIVVVPGSVCLVGEAEAAVGELDLVGSRSIGIGIAGKFGSPAATGPRVLRLKASVELGSIRVVNSRFYDPDSGSDSDRASESANDRACGKADPNPPSG